MKAEFIRNAQTQFLRDTVTHYNSSNRAMGADGNCCYSPTAKSDGCAIGRHVSNKEATRLLDDWVLYGIGDWLNTPLKAAVQFSAKLLVLSIDFLNAVQSLHDRSDNWGEDGLSDWGSGRVVEICSDFGLDSREVLEISGNVEELK